MSKNAINKFESIKDVRDAFNDLEDIVCNEGYSPVLLLRGSLHFYEKIVVPTLEAGNDEDLYSEVELNKKKP